MILKPHFGSTGNIVDRLTKSIYHGESPVHFVLKQNEPKVQGCEKIVGGHGVSATFYQWSTALRNR